MGEFVGVEVDQVMATIRLDRPPMNALNAQVQDEIAAASAEVSADPARPAVILYGGPKVFAAVARIPKPVGAALTGYAPGGGLELALCAGFRVAGQGARVGQGCSRPGTSAPECAASSTMVLGRPRSPASDGTAVTGRAAAWPAGHPPT